MNSGLFDFQTVVLLWTVDCGVCFSAGLSSQTQSILGFPTNSLPFRFSTSLYERYFSMGPQLLLHWGVGVVAMEN